MLLSLIRTNATPSEKTGILLIGGKPFCGTLEPPTVPNAAHPKGAIPLRWYKLTLTKSPHLGRVLPLVNLVPGFEGIRIHAGNTVKDTAGCILVGQLSGTTLFHSRPFTSTAQPLRSLSSLLSFSTLHGGSIKSSIFNKVCALRTSDL